MEKRNYEKYLEKIFTVKKEVDFSEGDVLLPAYLWSDYAFSQYHINSHPFVIARMHSIKTPFQKLMSDYHKLSDAFGKDVILCMDTISSYAKEQLISHQIPFIVPNRYLFLLKYSIFLEEKRKSAERKYHKMLSIGSQYLLYHLLASPKRAYDFNELVHSMNTNKMYISRATNELLDRNLIESVQEYGKTKFFISNKSSTWKKAQSILQNTIMSVDYVSKESLRFVNPLIPSGEYALSKKTYLDASRECYAVSNKQWKEISSKVALISEEDPRSIRIEIWKSFVPLYVHELNPYALAQSLTDIQDERIESMIEDILQRTWRNDGERLSTL